MLYIQSYEDVLAALRRLGDPPESLPATAGGARTRARLIEAAASCFERFGYRKASISTIAEAAGLSKAATYVHFEGKADLLLAVLLQERIALYERMAPLLAEPQPPAQRLHRLLAQAVVLAPTMPLSNRIKLGDPELLAALKEVDPARVRPAIALFGAIFAWLIREAAPPDVGEAEVGRRAQVMIMLLQTLPLFVASPLKGDLTPEALGEAFAEMLVRGAIAPPENIPPSP